MSVKSTSRWPPTPPGRGRRPLLSRASSIIIPATGARVNASQRNYTLTSAVVSEQTSPSSERTPLLGTSGSSTPGNNDGLAESKRRRMRRAWDETWTFATSEKAKMIYKCSLAYFLGSMATFVTPISSLLGHYDGKHLVSTVAVYFHPARTSGSMHEATIYALIAFLYSSILSIGSMGMSILLARQGLLQLGHALVLIIFCAGGLGYIGYTKIVKGSVTVSVACSLSALTFITILTKEGSVQLAQFTMGKIYQVTMIVIMGVVVSNLVSYTLWPTSAVANLRKLMAKTLDGFSDSLSLTTSCFLKSDTELMGSPDYIKAGANHKTIFSTLTKHLNEAYYEHLVRGTEKQYAQEKRLVESMQRLAQTLGGLRSAGATQFALMRQAMNKEDHYHTRPINVDSTTDNEPSEGSQVYSPPNRAFTGKLVVEDGEETWSSISSSNQSRSRSRSTRDAVEVEDSSGTTPVQISIFEEFLFHLGPPMRSLALTLKLLLDELPFDDEKTYKISVNPQFAQSLKTAIKLYEEKRTQALTTLYRSDAITQSRSLEDAADVEEIAASCGYFSYCLLHFAKELFTFLEILDELQRLQEHKIRSWEWLKFWKRAQKAVAPEDPEAPVLERQTAKLKKRPTIPNVAPEAGIPLSYKLWKSLSVVRHDSIKFGIKVGIGAALFALPAFLSSTRPTFMRWRGEWGLLSYMIVMSMTLGQTNNSAEARITGTIVGSFLSVVAWIAFPKNPYALSIFGALVSMPCFWIILNWKQATFGRFILLTYNLSALYAYSLSAQDDDDDDDEGGVNPIITDIALHRFVAVSVGVLWSLVVNRAIWPISARMQLRKGLSVLWLRMALVWNRDPLNDLTDENPDAKYAEISKASALQKTLLRLNAFLSAAPHEFRLKGPFPTENYSQILSATQDILDAFNGLSVIMEKEAVTTRHEVEILAYTRKERADLCARISHLFYVLGSSIRMGFPLPEGLPNTIRARDRLLARLFDYRAKIKGTEGEVDEDFALLYAYVLVTARISEGLDSCIENVGVLYGVLEEEMLDLGS